MTSLQGVDPAALRARLKAKGFATAGPGTQMQRPVNAPPHASVAEAQFWVQEQLDPGAGLNALGLWLPLDPPVSQQALFTALDALIQRHEALRSTYHEEDGALHVSVTPDSAPPLGAPLANTSSGGLSAALDGMRLSMLRGPLWQVRPALGAQGISGVLIGAHHAVMDWAGAGVMVGDLAASLTGASLGPVRQPQDHAHRLRQDMTTRRSAMQQYWTHRLQGCPAELTLPGAASRRMQPRTAYTAASLTLGAGRAAAIRARAAALSATPHTLFLAAYGVLLSRLGLSEEVIVGSAISSRYEAGDDAILGCLSDLVPLRLSLDPKESLATAIARIRSNCAKDFENATLGLGDIASCAGVARRAGHAPLVQAIFNMLPAWPDGAGRQSRIVPSAIARADIALEIRETPEARYEVRLELRSGLTPEGLLGTFLTGFDALLSGFDVDPATPLGQIALQDVRHDVPRPPRAPVDDLGAFLFQRLARQTGTAVITEDGCLSFAALTARAEALARALIGVGLTPGDAVAIHLPRSAELVIATLACLRAGGVLVLLDPGNPLARRTDILKRSGARHILASAIEPALAALADVVLPPTGETEGPAPMDWPKRSAGDTAYIVFTSGSTGAPKGVSGTHAGLLNRLLWMDAAYPVAQDDVALLKSSPSFWARWPRVFQW
jgi:hypothetical protein